MPGTESVMEYKSLLVSRFTRRDPEIYVTIFTIKRFISKMLEMCLKNDVLKFIFGPKEEKLQPAKGS